MSEQIEEMDALVEPDLRELLNALADFRPDQVGDFMERAAAIHQVRKGRLNHLYGVMDTFVRLLMEKRAEILYDKQRDAAHGEKIKEG